MLVHLVGSRHNIADTIHHLRLIVDAIHEEEHTIAYDWIEPTYISQTKEQKKTKDVDWPIVYADSIEAINKSDIVIADTTERSFSVGYQVAVAIQMKKPVLVLCRREASDSYFPAGIETGIDYKEYAKSSVKTIVKNFLRDNDVQAKDMRFNFFIDRPIYNYLRWASYKSGKTKAEIIRELISREITKGDY